MKTIFRPAMTLFAILTIICGLLYPLAVTVIAQTLFADKAGGSLVLRDGQPVGSLLIGQMFLSPKYFWGRPSATSPMPNNGASSGGSNLGPTNPAQIDTVRMRIEALKRADPGNIAPIPIDLVTASASGLDPEISIAAAYYQLERVARARNATIEEIRGMIAKLGKTRYLGFFGEPRVNVLALNLALDRAFGRTGGTEPR
ncbi:MAG TPA: potassium-transporting ATPase subunit KdpC [Nitrosospira sp.]|nr:potassium-transporting ATPase subunit KdpC [Nitrosospira sp.]